VLKNKVTIQARAACSLVSDRRWVVTGTPIDSEIEDTHGLLLALQVRTQREAGRPILVVLMSRDGMMSTA